MKAEDVPLIIELPTAEDLDRDWIVYAGKVKVSYQAYSTSTDSNTTTTANIDALNQLKGKREVETSDGNFQFREIREWNLRASQMPGVVVTKRGIITESTGKQWAVIECELKSFSTRWRCVCYAIN